MQQNNVTLRLARASARHPVWAVAAWFLLIATCIYVSTVVGMTSATQVDLGVGDSGRAAELAQEAGIAEPASEYVLIGPREGRPGGSAAREAAVQALGAALADSPEVSQVGAPVQSDDGEWILLPLVMAGDAQTASERVVNIRAVTQDVARDHPDVLMEQTGPASILAGVNEQLADDFVTAEMLSIPVTLIVLLVVFGAFVAAVVPIVLALTCVAGAVGLSAVISHVVPDSGTTANIILLIGMAVGVDYSLFYLKREREERRAGADSSTAIETAAATSGHAVVFSGAAVIVSLSGLYFVGDMSFTSLASAAILVVAVAVVGSLTVLPALLVLLSRFLDRPRVPGVWRLTNPKEERPPRVWPALLRPSLARPAVTMALTVIGLCVLALPALTLSLETQKADNLPPRIPAVATLHLMNAAFPQIGSSYTVVVRANEAEADAVAAALEGLAESTAATSGTAEPVQIVTSNDQRTTMLTLVSASDPESDVALNQLLELRETLLPDALDGVPGAEAFVGGQTAADHDYDENMMSKLPMVVGFVLLFNLVVMSLTFRSVVIGVVTLLMNLLSTGAAFGVLVLVFQNSWADGLLGYTSTGTIISWVPLFLFVILIGLSMDYHVFVLHRVYEEALSGAQLRDAVRNGIVHSAGVVTGAALVMAAVFSVFATLSFPEFKQLAVGLGVAVILDVVVIRGFLLPATLLVTGRWTWWPGPLSRRRPVTAGQPLDDVEHATPVSV